MAVHELTKLMYANALEEMLQTTSLEKIRIKDLCKKCGVDRQNFYYHFKDKYALVAWIFERDFSSSVYKCSEQLSVSLLTEILQKIKAHSKFYKKAFLDNSQNSLKNWLYEFAFETNKKILMCYFHSAYLTEEQKFSVIFTCYGWMWSVIEWLNQDCRILPSEFAEMQFRMLPELLRNAYNGSMLDL